VLPAAVLVLACVELTGLDDLSVESAASTADAAAFPYGGTPCTTNRECGERVGTSLRADKAVPAVCVQPERQCVPLLSEDCTTVTGDYLDDRAIVIGSLFSTRGSQGATNLPRQQAAMLAVEEINRAGGIPAGRTSAGARPLVLVSCDESTDLLRAGEHLVSELHVPAIIGPNTSQDTLDLSNELTIAAGTAVISPTAVASSISALLDDDLTWLMVPSDEQRAPLMMHQIQALESELRSGRKLDRVKLGVVFRNDALGIGTRSALNGLVFNGATLADPINLGDHVRIDPYDYRDADQAALVEAYVEFAPDIVVLAGTAEAVTQVMVPLEAGWPSEKPRPHYVVIDSTKVPELLAAVADDADLRARIRGTGLMPDPASAAIYNAFKVEYQLRFPNSPSSISGMGPSYDATYAVAYALAATNARAPSGDGVAQGLRQLAGGAVRVEVGKTDILAAFQQLAAAEPISAIGTFAPLEWNEHGAVSSGLIEVWCIGLANQTPAYQSSGLTFDVQSQEVRGEYVPCSK
jgi:branched-chain amino acid transport system substrate-binding protein